MIQRWMFVPWNDDPIGEKACPLDGIAYRQRMVAGSADERLTPSVRVRQFQTKVWS
jgi:hypothetical protein